MPRKKKPSTFEAALEALLAEQKAKVDAHVERVRVAADHWVEMFRCHAENLLIESTKAANPMFSYSMRAADDRSIQSYLATEEEAPRSSLTPDVLAEIGNLNGVQVTDNSASSANMRV